MRGIALLSACVLVLGCAEKEVAKTPPPVVTGIDCYTVDLFDSFPIQEPAPDVPPEYAQYLGDWGDGAWNNEWCHDLRITKVHRDGKVEMVDMHAPHEPFGQPATAFKRTGRITEDGKLRFSHGTERREYEVVSGRLVGLRSGLYGNLRAVLSNREEQGVEIAKVKN